MKLSFRFLLITCCLISLQGFAHAGAEPRFYPPDSFPNVTKPIPMPPPMVTPMACPTAAPQPENMWMKYASIFGAFAGGLVGAGGASLLIHKAALKPISTKAPEELPA